MPVFLLQIVDGRTGQLVSRFPAGGNPPAGGSMEADLVEACVEAIAARGDGDVALDAAVIEACTQTILAKGVGFWRTSAQVATAIREALAGARLHRPLEDDLRAGIIAAIRALKDETVRVVPIGGGR